MEMLKTITVGLDPYKSIFSELGGVANNWKWNNELKLLCERAGVTVVSMHALRHTYASILRLSGIPTASISNQLGHSSTRVTEKIYLHLLDEQKRKDVSEIRNTLGSL